MHDTLSQAQAHWTIEIHLVLSLSSAPVHLLECHLWIVIEPEWDHDYDAGKENVRDLLVLDDVETFVNVNSSSLNAAQLQPPFSKPKKQKVNQK